MPGWASSTGNIAGFIADLILRGTTPTSGLSEFRDAGGRIGNGRWFEIWNDTKSAVENKADMIGLPGHRRPDDSMFSPWSTKRPGEYGYQISITTYDRDSGSIIQRQHTQFYDQKVSIDKAINDSLDQITNDEGTIGTETTEVVLGATLSNLYITVPIEGGW